jgi:hypothetical protein
MATHLVNLDALIKREDFEAASDQPQSKRLGNELKVEALEGTFAHLLRKPDFQRETANWNPEKIADFIKSFLDGDLIPATIMWWSQLNGTVFVIDGAHRLSALIAWVRNDYGDMDISQEFFSHSIPSVQRRLAELTRRLIDDDIGSFKRLKHLAANPSTSPSDLMLKRARALGTFKIDLQWVEGGAAAAEKSFFKINTGSSIIDPTELGILKARQKPNAIATRALMRGGAGHKYWSRFELDQRTEIERLAVEINDHLFKPLLEVPVKTLDLPIAGQAYSADSFKMIFDLVNLVNNVTPAMWEDRSARKKKAAIETILPDDVDGTATIAFLSAVKKASELVSGAYAGSLGFHPVVYFYGATGRFQPTAFLAAIKFAGDLKRENALVRFTDNRAAFEEFLVRHRHYINQLAHAYGSRTRSLDPLVLMYRLILEEISAGRTDDDAIVARLKGEPRLRELKEPVPGVQTTRRRFTTDAKSTAFIRSSIDSPIRCDICGARLHRNSISFDHAVRQQDGGLGGADNAQPTHPYCNTGYKEKAISDARKGA